MSRRSLRGTYVGLNASPKNLKGCKMRILIQHAVCRRLLRPITSPPRCLFEQARIGDPDRAEQQRHFKWGTRPGRAAHLSRPACHFADNRLCLLLGGENIDVAPAKYGLHHLGKPVPLLRAMALRVRLRT